MTYIETVRKELYPEPSIVKREVEQIQKEKELALKAELERLKKINS